MLNTKPARDAHATMRMADEVAEAARLKRRALERWENEGGAPPPRTGTEGGPMTIRSGEQVDAGVVLVVVGDLASAGGLRNAESVVHAMGGPILLVRVHAVSPAVADQSERLPGLEVDFEPTLELSASSWAEAASPSRVASEPRTPLTRGGFIETLLEIAAARSVQLVVLLGVADERIAWITELAHALRRPVLLARSNQPGKDVVVAATSLADPEMPIVDFALDLAHRVGATLEILHHASGLEKDEPPYRERARARLAAHAAKRGRETDETIAVVLTRGSSAETDILEFAVQKEPRLLVLGSYPRSWLTGALIPSVCEAVCAQAATSVVILPLSGEP